MLVQKREIFSRLLLFVIIITFVISACSNSIAEKANISTWTPSPTVTATCVPNISLSTPEGWGKTRIIVVLYDERTIEEELYFQLENGEETQDPSLLVKTVIPKIIKPSDQVSVFQLGYSSFDDATVSRVFSYTTLPELLNTPIPPSVIPTHIPVTLTPGLGYVATQNAMTQQVKEIIATNSVNESEYLCAVDYWNKVVQQTATKWDVVATAEISNITEKMYLEFEIYNSEEKKREREQPYRTNELYYGGLYYGLSFATMVFGDQCENGADCMLIVVDDFGVYDEDNSDNLHIDLRGVDIIAIMPNCRYIDQPSCVETQRYWNEEISDFGAQKIEYWNGSRAEINIINFVGR